MKKLIIILCLAGCNTIAAQDSYTLQQLTDSALQHNIAMSTARHDIMSATEQRKEAYTKYFPNVSGTGAWLNANKHLVSADINPTEYIPQSLAASLSQMLPAEALAALSSPVSIGMLKNGVLGGINAILPVYVGGQIVNGNKLAKVGEEVSQLKLQLSENEVILATEQYYWQLVTLQEKMKTLEAVEALLASIEKDVTTAVKAGIVLNNDLLQVRLRQNETESMKVKLQNGISVVKLLLAHHCGLNAPDFTILHTPLSSSESSVVQPNDELFAMNHELGNLPEYQLLQKNVEATALQQKMEVGKNMPSVGIGVGYNYNNLMDKSMSFGMVFATVSIPISDWWGGSHAIKRKKIEARKAVEQLEDNARLLRIRMQSAWNDMNDARRQVAIARKSVEQSQENLRLNQDFYRAGTVKMSDLLDAQMLYQQAADQLVDAQSQFQLKQTEYRRAAGMPLR